MDYRSLIGCEPIIKNILPSIIIEATRKYFNIDNSDLVSIKQRHKICHARFIAMYLIKQNSALSNKKIASLFSPAIKKDDHTAISYALAFVRKHEQQLLRDIKAIETKSFFLDIKQKYKLYIL